MDTVLRRSTLNVEAATFIQREGADMTAAPTRSAPDYDEIVRLIHIYTDNFGGGDPKVLQEPFHEDAWIFFTEADGTLVKERIWDCLERWATPPKLDVVGRIISVTQAGDVANVLLGFDIVGHLDDSWVDLHNLIRVDGVWKITNKTATHTSRSAGA
ncbi:MAG TPA: nuclear transport factor 2 family protein [Microlunatus sp.]